MNLISGETGQFGAPPGLSALIGISISSLNPFACKNTTFTINGYEIDRSQTPLYRTDGQVSLCNDSQCAPGTNSENDVTININGAGEVSLGNPDLFHTLSYDKNTGVFRVDFLQPTMLANQIGNLTIQSGPLN